MSFILILFLTELKNYALKRPDNFKLLAESCKLCSLMTAEKSDE